MHITLKPNEKIYINGAVLRVDRKVSLELLNDAVFLLEPHVMTEAAAVTPLRRLYYVVQLMLMEPHDLETKRVDFNLQGLRVASRYHDDAIQAGLATMRDLIDRGRAFEALKVLRGLFAREDSLMSGAASAAPTEVAPMATASRRPSPARPRQFAAA